MSIKISTELIDGCVLAVLVSEDKYGYEITQEIRKRLSVSESTMYPVLRRLQKNDFLSTYDKPFQGRNRRYYHITETGFEHLKVIKEDWHEYRKQIDFFLGGE